MTPLTHLPTFRKPRERLWEHGPSALTLEEVVAVLLGSGSSQHDVLSLSYQVALQLRNGKPSLAQLAQIPGIGSAKAAVIMAAFQLPAVLEREEPSPLLSSEHIYSACRDLLLQPQENLVVFFLSARHQPLRRETVTVGTATASLVHPREVFRPAIVHNATSIILAHNHPSGDPTPSVADRQATRSIAQAGVHLGITLLDHVICAAKSYTSLKAESPELFS